MTNTYNAEIMKRKMIENCDWTFSKNIPICLRIIHTSLRHNFVCHFLSALIVSLAHQTVFGFSNTTAL